MGIVVIGAVFVDIKGFPEDIYVPEGRNAGRIEYIHGGVTRNVVEDIANVELRPTYVSIVDTSAGLSHKDQTCIRFCILLRKREMRSFLRQIPSYWKWTLIRKS